MKVSTYIAGAPGTGKSNISKMFAEKIVEAGVVDEMQVIDGYVEDVVQTGFPVGAGSTYLSTLSVMYRQQVMEEKMRSSNSNFVTAGGLIENMAHSGINVEVLQNGLKTPENDMRIVREMGLAQMLSFLVADRIMYSIVFYSPYDQPKLIVEGKENENLFNERLDAAIQAILSNFRIPIIQLEGTDEEKADQMVKVLVEAKQAIEQQEGEVEDDQSKGSTEEVAAVSKPETDGGS